MNKKNKSLTLLGLRLSALVEIAIFFVLCFLISILSSSPINFFAVCPHPFWIIVILISAQYGTIEGLVAALVATIIYLLGPIPSRDILVEKALYFFELAKTPISWFVAALILGELRMRHIRERDLLRETAWNAEEREGQVAEAYNTLKKIKERLEVQVASEIPTALMLIDSFKEIERKEPVKIIEGTKRLIEILVNPEKFSIYLLEGEELKLNSAHHWEEKDNFKDVWHSDTSLYNAIVIGKRVVSITQKNDIPILKNEGVLAAPIVDPDTKQVYGMIKVEMIPFFHIKMATIESLRVIGEWVGISFSRLVK